MTLLQKEGYKLLNLLQRKCYSIHGKIRRDLLYVEVSEVPWKLQVWSWIIAYNFFKNIFKS